MKKIFRSNRFIRFYFPLGCVIFLAVILFSGNHAIAENAVLRSMFSCQAQGLGGVVPTIKVWYQQGTNLSFIQTGEIIRKVWLNDPSQVTLDFDGPMCMQFGQENPSNVGDCENSAASVIHLRRIKKLDIPGLVTTDNTLLTVVTQGANKNKLYTFRILYEDGFPEYHTLAIYPDPNGNDTACVRTPN